jgi:hypothetical protein
MAYFLAAGMQPATLLSAGMGEAVFSSRLAHTRATKHEAAHAETEAVAEDGRCCMRARCMTTEQPPRRSPQKPRVACGRPRPHIYRVVQPVCAGRAIRGPDLRRSVSLTESAQDLASGFSPSFGPPCFVDILLGGGLGPPCGARSRHVLIERKAKSNAGGLVVLLID